MPHELLDHAFWINNIFVVTRVGGLFVFLGIQLFEVFVVELFVFDIDQNRIRPDRGFGGIFDRGLLGGNGPDQAAQLTRSLFVLRRYEHIVDLTEAHSDHELDKGFACGQIGHVWT